MAEIYIHIVMSHTGMYVEVLDSSWMYDVDMEDICGSTITMGYCIWVDVKCKNITYINTA